MLGEQVGEDVHAGVDGLGEVLLLVADDTGDIRLLLAQLRVLALVFVHDHVHDLIQERLVDAQQLAVAGGAAQQAAQHVAAALMLGRMPSQIMKVAERMWSVMTAGHVRFSVSP